MSLSKSLILAATVAAGAETLTPDQVAQANESPNNYPANYEQIATLVTDARENLVLNEKVEESISDLQSAADQGNKQASMLLSEIYTSGTYTDQDPKLANFYFKNAIFNSWSFPEPRELDAINDPAKDLDYVLLKLPSIIANRVKSVATNGTASILYGDPELMAEEQDFAYYVGRAIRGVAEYAFSDMNATHSARKGAQPSQKNV
ncbi:MAG: hypothetical protein ACTS9Y_01275 [Methylophilus sp.]|uniref:hypothetical protein n=1 Tax=Methylophilus sp. TaxID=29541 RepID=UPI003F9FEA11